MKADLHSIIHHGAKRLLLCNFAERDYSGKEQTAANNAQGIISKQEMQKL